jgi:WhiB family redox-sensing transcriptional regulator
MTMTCDGTPIEGKNWQQHGACLDRDPELFFPLNETNTDPATLAQIAEAKAVCKRCPVMARCRADAFEVGDFHAIRGGLTGSERDEMQRARARRALPAPAAVGESVDAQVDAELERERRRRDADAQREYRARRKAAMTPEQLAEYNANRAAAKRIRRAGQRSEQQYSPPSSVSSEGAA